MQVDSNQKTRQTGLGTNAWPVCLALAIAALVVAGCSGGSVSGWPGAAVGTDLPQTDPDAPVGTDLSQPLPLGDAQAGRRWSQAHDCEGCHANLPVGPLWQPDDAPVIGKRAAAAIKQPDYDGQATTAEQYLLEAIVAPEAYVAPEWPAGVMPNGYHRLLSRQEAADMIAYLLSLK